MVDEQEQEIISSKSFAQVSHPLPMCPSPTVWIWESDPNNFPVKHGLNWTQAVQIFWKYRNSQWWYDPQRDQWDLFQSNIPRKLPHYNDFLNPTEPLPLDTNWPFNNPSHNPDKFSFNDVFENPSYDDHGLEMTENHVIESASNISTLQSNNHLPPSSKSPPPMPEWTDPNPIVNNTSTNVDDHHAFDQTITPMTWAYQHDAEENLYIQQGDMPRTQQRSMEPEI